MHKTKMIFLLLLIPAFLYSQEPDVDIEWDIHDMDLYMRGDQTFIISLGTVFPALFIFRDSETAINAHNLARVGMTGSLSYNFFLNANVSLGGEIGFMVLNTVGENSLFLIPIGLRGGYQFNFWRFEFPITYTFGISWHRYLDHTYFGIYMKFGGAIYYRFNPDWSFGLNTAWSWFPQWTGDRNRPAGERRRNAHGNIVELTLSARYHF